VLPISAKEALRRAKYSAADALSQPCLVVAKADHETFQAIEQVGMLLLVVDPICQ
jgi:hypothetical protein